MILFAADSPPPTPITKVITWPSCQAFTAELGVEKINEFMDDCWEKSDKWRHCTDFLRQETNEHDVSYKYQVIHDLFLNNNEKSNKNNTVFSLIYSPGRLSYWNVTFTFYPQINAPPLSSKFLYTFYMYYVKKHV